MSQYHQPRDKERKIVATFRIDKELWEKFKQVYGKTVSFMLRWWIELDLEKHSQKGAKQE